MVTIKITKEEMEQLKQVVNAYNDSGMNAAKEKFKELKIMIDQPADGEPIGGCVSCVLCVPAHDKLALAAAAFVLS